MDQKVKARWLKALKSGNYKQGRGRLKTPRGNHCCLGVLCEVERVPYVPEDGLLPYDFARNIGLTVDVQSDLAELNDSAHRTDYKSVINYIEEKL